MGEHTEWWLLCKLDEYERRIDKAEGVLTKLLHNAYVDDDGYLAVSSDEPGPELTDAEIKYLIDLAVRVAAR
jgi:hypothetical protein